MENFIIVSKSAQLSHYAALLVLISFTDMYFRTICCFAGDQGGLTPPVFYLLIVLERGRLQDTVVRRVENQDTLIEQSVT